MTSHTPYYKTNNLLWRWRRCEGAQGCEIVPDASLSMDKSPPPLPVSKVSTAPKPSPPPNRMENTVNGVLDAFEALGRFKTWLDAPDPPKLAPIEQKKIEVVPLFDIQEIPRAMRKEFLENSAKLMERWFSGELNYGPAEKDVREEINQKGEPYPSSMYDMTTIKLDWVLKYPRGRDAYDDLITARIRSRRAYDQLQRILRHYVDHTSINAWSLCKQSLRELHRRFQFTYANVGGTFAQKISELIETAKNRSVPDDLAGSLGSFNIYAAIGSANFVEKNLVDIRGIYVYIKDSYDFTDESGGVSQYLGHWGRNGVIVVPYNAVAAALNKSPLYTQYPVAVGDVHKVGNVYYPVQNQDFRKWAIRHKRGGDFIIYSDKRWIPVTPPIRVAL